MIVHQISEFPDYDVWEDGTIWNPATGRQIHPSRVNGSWKVNLRYQGEPHTRSVARIVCIQFHGLPQPGYVVSFKDDNPDNLHQENLEWKPKWYAQERANQNRRTAPIDGRQIMMESTGDIYDNSLECARLTGGIEKYIVMAARNPGNAIYNGSTYRFIQKR